MRDRDAAALAEAMAALDREEAAIQAPADVEAVPADKAVEYLRELPRTWARARGGKGRQLLASALFDRIDVLGLQEMAFTLSAHAARYGVGAVLPGELRLPANGRGERIGAEAIRVIVRGSAAACSNAEIRLRRGLGRRPGP